MSVPVPMPVPVARVRGRVLGAGACPRLSLAV